MSEAEVPRIVAGLESRLPFAGKGPGQSVKTSFLGPGAPLAPVSEG